MLRMGSMASEIQMTVRNDDSNQDRRLGRGRDDGDPVSYLMLAAGTPVYASGGEHLGFVRSVLDNPREGIFDGIVIATTGTARFVDAPEVLRCAERAVTLSLSAEEATRLPQYVPGPPVQRLADGLHDEEGVAHGASEAPAQLAVARALARSRAIPVVLAYLIVGIQLPTAFYAAGVGVCLVLLALWFFRWRGAA